LVSVPRDNWSFRRLANQLPHRLRKVLTVMEEKDSSGAPLHEKRDQRGIRLRRVAVSAGEDQVVRPVIGRLPPAGPNMVQSDRLLIGLGAAIRADRAVLGE